MNTNMNTTRTHTRSTLLPFVVAACSLAALSSCGGDSSNTDAPESLTIVAYDSFTPPDGAFDAFTDETGIAVKVVAAGDAGEMVSKAALTAGNPEGDVMWGVDNTLLQRALDAGVFDPYSSPIDGLADDLRSISDAVTPVDFGDVCVNYDVDYLEANDITPPSSLEDLASPEYAELLVTEDPTTSSTGLAFMLATRVAFGDGWLDYWRSLRDNGLSVVSSWDDAYYASFTLHGGDRPLVVSYATSPPAEMIFADPPYPEGMPAVTGVATGTCFRQVEFAGVLAGSKHVDTARRLVDYLAGETFQSGIAESLFVFPANTRVAPPESFEKYAPTIVDPYTMSPEEIAANRDTWLEEWTSMS